MQGRGAIFLEKEADQRGDLLNPLRDASDSVGELAKLVGGFELEPSEMELRDICKELAGFNSSSGYSPLPNY